MSPEACLDIIARLGTFDSVRAYTGGRSYEDRPVPVLEIFTPREGTVSTARLITFKPTLQLSARQHANEISSTNYTLKLAELLARDRAWQEAARKINFVIQPMENPDGAAVASELARLAPFHSLHAGRYGSLGVDIGAQVDPGRPVLPEAAVRTGLYDQWLPDIYLNLHGYPVPRMGPAVLQLFALPLPGLSDPPRLVRLFPGAGPLHLRTVEDRRTGASVIHHPGDPGG